MGTAWPNTRPDDKQAGGGRYCRRRAADHAHRHRPQDPCGWPPSHQPRHAPVHAAATSQRAGHRPRQRVPGPHPGGRGPVTRRPRHPHRPQRRDLPSDGLVRRRAGPPGVHAAPLGRVPGLAGRPAGRPLPRHHAVPVRRPVPRRLRRLPDGGDVLRRDPADLSPALSAGAVPGRLQLLPGGRAPVRPPPGHLRVGPAGRQRLRRLPEEPHRPCRSHRRRLLPPPRRPPDLAGAGRDRRTGPDPQAVRAGGQTPPTTARTPRRCSGPTPCSTSARGPGSRSSSVATWTRRGGPWSSLWPRASASPTT